MENSTHFDIFEGIKSKT